LEDLQTQLASKEDEIKKLNDQVRAPVRCMRCCDGCRQGRCS
jgi:hypothetical protein